MIQKSDHPKARCTAPPSRHRRSSGRRGVVPSNGPAILLLILVTLGCPANSTLPELGEVSGVITIDGRPLPEASIVFRPQKGGRFATALSDREGRYELSYISYPHLVYGTRTGENTVFVSTYQGSTGNVRKIRPELVPECYRGLTSDLKVHVKRGRNVINLELKTDCDVEVSAPPVAPLQSKDETLSGNTRLSGEMDSDIRPARIDGD